MAALMSRLPGQGLERALERVQAESEGRLCVVMESEQGIPIDLRDWGLERDEAKAQADLIAKPQVIRLAVRLQQEPELV